MYLKYQSYLHQVNQLPKTVLGNFSLSVIYMYMSSRNPLITDVLYILKKKKLKYL